MGWFNIFKRKVTLPAKPERAEREEDDSRPRTASFYAYTLDGGHESFYAECPDSDSAVKAAKEWAKSIEGAYYYIVYYHRTRSTYEGYIGNKYPWSCRTSDHKRYSGVVEASNENMAVDKIKLKLREALGVTHLGEFTLQIGRSVDKCIDHLEITLP